jgi:hypothetical protein
MSNIGSPLVTLQEIMSNAQKEFTGNCSDSTLVTLKEFTGNCSDSTLVTLKEFTGNCSQGPENLLREIMSNIGSPLVTLQEIMSNAQKEFTSNAARDRE